MLLLLFLHVMAITPLIYYHVQVSLFKPYFEFVSATPLIPKWLSKIVLKVFLTLNITKQM